VATVFGCRTIPYQIQHVEEFWFRFVERILDWLSRTDFFLYNSALLELPQVLQFFSSRSGNAPGSPQLAQAS
jgi:hypothetical protein